ncbi:MAG: DUF559 domain-containing protein [Chloroflexi bacterium]|nr:DUF559 domain-containing protein [Chloroflexota bacterium]
MQPNHVERQGYSLLNDLGVEYVRQHLVGNKFCVDAFVPCVKLVIQFDGDYWHGNPAFFPNPDARQRKRMIIDKSQDAYMATCGFTVCRIWASDLKIKPETIKAQLLDVLARLEHIRALPE